MQPTCSTVTSVATTPHPARRCAPCSSPSEQATAVAGHGPRSCTIPLRARLCKTRLARPEQNSRVLSTELWARAGHRVAKQGRIQREREAVTKEADEDGWGDRRGGEKMIAGRWSRRTEDGSAVRRRAESSEQRAESREQRSESRGRAGRLFQSRRRTLNTSESMTSILNEAVDSACSGSGISLTRWQVSAARG